jgi:hypothetical protein
VARRGLKNACGPIGPITRYGRTARFGAGTFREPINIWSSFFACSRRRFGYIISLSDFGRMVGGENYLFAGDHQKPGRATSRCRHASHPHLVCQTMRIPVSACISPVIYRQPATARLSLARRSRCGSSTPWCQADLHLGVSMPARHNIRLRQSCDGLSAGRPGAYHDAFDRVVPGRRMAARRRRACSRSAATASMGSRS